MNINEIINKVSSFKRYECRDLTFGDTEVYIEDANNNEVGSGYFGGKHADMTITIDSHDYKFTGSEAYRLREAIRVAKISRNDNNGEW